MNDRHTTSCQKRQRVIICCEISTLAPFISIACLLFASPHVERLRRSNGIVGCALDWLKSYYTGRSQFVRFNGKISATTRVTCRVPQGSVLGAVLFLLYAAGVINLVEECGFSAHAYSDNLQVYQHVSPAQSSELLEQMANCVSRVEAWMASNRLHAPQSC